MNNKFLVLYDTRTKNTKKIADVIAEELDCKSVHIDKFKSKKYDLVVIGSPVHNYRATKKIRSLLPKIESKKFAFFCTYGAPLWGSKSADSCLSGMENKVSSESIGKFKCKGHYKILRTYKDHPDKQDLKDARKFAKGIIKKI